ncbi:hypothetical protein IF2G_06530 [Cordyceps javanica]|nr:hypothetical protein IF2G_06530 [Cordyceps javanica]
MRHHGTYERLNESNKSSKSSNVNKLRPQVVSPGVAASLGGRTRRGSHLLAGPSATRDSQDNGQTRDFYRKPRTRPSHSATWHSSSTLSHSSCSSGRDGPSSAAHSLGSGSEQDISLPGSSTQYLSHANNDQPESSPKVDYSFREADLFYGVVPDEASTRDTPDSAGACNTSSEPAATSETGTGAESRNQTQWWRPKFSTTWTRKFPLLVQPAPKEEGFQVVRPGNAAFRMARMKQAQAQAQAMHSDHGEGQDSHAPSDTLSSDGVSDESVSRDTR